ncbi:putative baseplate assembly protein [Paenibacillus koleovorans]|uniref:putative baseplate assembly protein n=1 Tax=Paenibacillus koleovorans TaxID=121608 RepID=UPI000FDBA06D|nr:putative baseplate assembly protein [Paenibacillus koleovorans]
MLPQLNLDDRVYGQMVEEARKAIPAVYPDWTDENTHDPGITFLEMFSWLIEMQQYYLNQVTEKNELKYLKLLGTAPHPASPAVASITCTAVQEETLLPRGTKLLAEHIPFETTETALLLPIQLTKIIVRSHSSTQDFTSNNNSTMVSFYAFGSSPAKGNRLYIGLSDRLPQHHPVSLMIQMFEQYPIAASPIDPGDIYYPSGQVTWKYYGADEQGVEDWHPVQLLDDATYHFSQSGKVKFQVSQPMLPKAIHPEADVERFWLCCEIENGSYEIPPKVDRISLNSVRVSQQSTLSLSELRRSDGEPDQTFVLDHDLSYSGVVHVQVKDDEGRWSYWTPIEDWSKCLPESTVYSLELSEKLKQVIVRFGDGRQGLIPPEGANRIRLISVSQDFEPRRMIGRSTGLPNQVFKLLDGPLLQEQLVLQVGRRERNTGAWLWEDWTQVADFDLSKPWDRHYRVNVHTGEILFSNNENGSVPEAADRDNICLLSLRTGGGEHGNVQAGLITRFEAEDQFPGIRISNDVPAAHGKLAETIEQAKERVLLEMHQPECAVTIADIERIVRSAPGTRVARVKVLPLYRVGMTNYPEQKAPGQMTVVVVPYSESQKPVPSAGFLRTIGHHLDRYRLVTTEVHVIQPEYVKVTVHAVVVIGPTGLGDKTAIVQLLNSYLRPFDSANGDVGWEFGKPVYKGDIYDIMNRAKGVSYIQDVWLSAEGRGIQKDQNGNIQIPSYGLVYSGEHEIEFMRHGDL